MSAHQFANKWFLTLFSCVLPLELVYRIWDLYVWEGWEAITKVGLAILKLSEGGNFLGKIVLKCRFFGKSEI